VGVTRPLRVGWYRFTTTFRRRWGSYLALALLVGLIGGLAMGAVAAGRRTQESFATFLASTNPSSLQLVSVAGPNLTADFERLPGVERVGAVDTGMTVFPLERSGAPKISAAAYSGEIQPIGSVNGEYFDQDRVTATTGRVPSPSSADEFVATAEDAQLQGWHVGETILMGFYTAAQSNAPGFASGKVRPALRVEMKLVGTVVFNNEVVLDEVDRYPTYSLFTPALVRRFTSGDNYFSYGLQLRNGTSSVATVEREIVASLPKGTTYQFHVTSVVSSQVDQTVLPESIALAVFGAIAGIAALLIALQVVARQLRAENAEHEILRALGATRSATISDGLFGIVAAVVAGSLLAVVVALGLSFAAPIGPVRAVYPTPGISVDATVLGFGLLVLVGGLSVGSVALATRLSPGRVLREEAARPPRVSRLAGAVSRFGAPASVVAGVRFALESGRGRSAVPVRSALFGTATAVVIVVATLTFGSGLNTLVSHPSLYGWNWSYAVGSNYVVPSEVLPALKRDPDVAAFSGVSFADVQINKVTVPVLLVNTRAAVSAPLLAGHPIETDRQIVLGEATLKQLHARLGETVYVAFGGPKDAPVYVPPTPVQLVGTATLPAIGQAQTLHTSMGTGAMVPIDLEPPAFRRFLTSPNPTLNGPTMVLVRLRSGIDGAAAVKNLASIAAVGNRAFAAIPGGGGAGASVDILPVQYPAQIENYRSIGTTPVLLAGGLAIGAVVALGLTLLASVRRRRRDLALLKIFGFTQRQLASCVAWQSTISAGTGLIVGVPLGIALGRWLWVEFAREISAVPQATVPALLIVFVGVAALVLANLVAGFPGRFAARVPTALVLRTE
jgi:hypothetical protein